MLDNFKLMIEKKNVPAGDEEQKVKLRHILKNWKKE